MKSSKEMIYDMGDDDVNHIIPMSKRLLYFLIYIILFPLLKNNSSKALFKL